MYKKHFRSEIIYITYICMCIIYMYRFIYNKHTFNKSYLNAIRLIDLMRIASVPQMLNVYTLMIEFQLNCQYNLIF